MLRTASLVALSGGAVLTLDACGAGGQAEPPVSISASPSGAPTAASPAPSTPAVSTPAASTPATSTPATSTHSSTPSASPTVATPDGPSVKTSDVPVDGGVILDQAKVVVTQPTKGSYKAFSAVCTHRGCTVGSVRGGVIVCPCHGSEFSIEDGSVEQPPARKALPERGTTVVGSKVYVTD